jgi:hypothetical protein
MTHVPTYDQLREFFLAYLNPDWDLDAADHDAVIDEFLAVEDPEHVGDVRRDAQRLLEDTPEESTLQTVLLENGLSVSPHSDEFATRSWLQHLVARLAPQ